MLSISYDMLCSYVFLNCSLTTADIVPDVVIGPSHYAIDHPSVRNSEVGTVVTAMCL